MIKKILQTTVLTLLMMTMMSGSVYASAKMEVALGEQVTLEVKNLFDIGDQVQWAVRKDGELLNVQSNPVFNYTFLQQGEHEVVVEVEGRATQTRSSTVYVLAGARYNQDGTTESETGGLNGGSAGPIELVYQTLPPQDAAGNVRLLRDGRFALDIRAIDPRILEYRVDYNLFEDGDGDGIANNDIDNANEQCFLIGGICQTLYTLGESEKVTAQITLVSRTGEKIQEDITILFDDPPERSGDLIAQLELVPVPSSQSGIVNLYKDTHEVGFYAKNSLGDIQEYRIDKNIFFDSNGDGNPSNDIDNLNHDSFRSGDVWVTEYEKTDAQIIASLTIVGPDGRGSRIERGILFTDSPTIDTDGQSSDTSIQLKADKPFVLLGDPVTFSVENLTKELSEYTFEWDFDGDQVVDKAIEGENRVSHIYEDPGIFPAKVMVTDSNGNAGDFSLDFLVQVPETTKADFEFNVQGPTVSFTNLSSASVELADKTLNYQWSFGETDETSYESQQDQIAVANPVYTYSQPGTYSVTLTVVDANRIKESKTVEVVVAEGVVGGTVEEPDSDEGGGSIIVTILKVLLYIFIAVFIILLLFFGGLTLFIKLQHSDLAFGEVIDEVKLKLLSILGLKDLIEEDTAPSADAEEVEAELMQDVAESASSDVETKTGQAADVQPSGLSNLQTPGPIRLDDAPIDKSEEEEEGEEVIEASHPGTGPIPDWLKPKPDSDVPTASPQSSSDQSEGQNQTFAQSSDDQNETQGQKLDSEGNVPSEDATPSQEEEMKPEVSQPEPSITPQAPVTAEPQAPSSVTKTPLVPSEPAASATENDANNNGGSLNTHDGPVPDWLKGE